MEKIDIKLNSNFIIIILIISLLLNTYTIYDNVTEVKHRFERADSLLHSNYTEFGYGPYSINRNYTLDDVTGFYKNPIHSTLKQTVLVATIEYVCDGDNEFILQYLK